MKRETLIKTASTFNQTRKFCEFIGVVVIVFLIACAIKGFIS